MIEPPVRGFTGPDTPSDSIYNQCVRCGLCLPSCPTYLETLTETSSPRGRISLIKAVGDGELDLLSPGFVHQMSECLDCRACEAACPSGVAYGQLVETARTQIQAAAAPAAPPQARFARFFGLRLLFTHMVVMRVAAALLRFYQRSGLQAAVRASGILRALKLDALEAMAPRISDRFFTPRNQRFEAPDATRTAFLHAGCIMHVAFADVNAATVRMLARAKCRVIVPAGQGCCGAITVHAGDMPAGRELAKRNIAAFEQSGADYYVINAAGCGSTLKEYGRMFAHDAQWAPRAQAFSARVRDITELLDELGITPPDRRIDQTVTYQEPCHLAHAQRITSAPRRLMQQIPGLSLVEMDESSLCCGSAGIYNLTQPEMAKRLQDRKIANACATNADVVVTANPGCELQLRAGLLAAGSAMSVKHIVSLLDEAYEVGS
ncbi:MAG: heterodisulfide reductase-related iron-sulfur binding cluster [Candidatus Eremiobacteraeota bacterium]|nr:heterodisulfide reductase-related iron-sulfur binding cluster [Candidatus Eremiobacteraeota bacterium]